MKTITDSLKELSGRKHILLTSRGNKAIMIALEIAKNKGKRKVLIQDQGGWITYRQYPKKLRMDIINIKTDRGITNLYDLRKNADKDSVFLVNSMPGYFTEERMGDIAGICQKAGCFLINDISGSIGTENAKKGDIAVCSFGKHKPVNAGHGGFVGADNKLLLSSFQSDFSWHNQAVLLREIIMLRHKLRAFRRISAKIKDDLHDLEVIHRESKGINVVVAFHSQDEKERIINYCKANNLEFTLCPRYIRVEEDAVSIEVKRMR